MKHFFRYEHGYINIDDEAVCVNNTGNWQDVNELKSTLFPGEKIQGVKPLRVGLFLFLFLLVYGVSFLSSLVMGVIGIGAFVSGYFLYRYLQTELGPKIVLPFGLISEIFCNNQKLTIRYSDARGQEDTLELRFVKGFHLEYIGDIKIGYL